MNQAPTFPFFEFALTRQKYLDIKLIPAFKEVKIFGVYYC